MATATTIVTKQIVLELNEKEAAFLRDVLQNSAIEDEPEDLNKQRSSIFYALRNSLE